LGFWSKSRDARRDRQPDLGWVLSATTLAVRVPVVVFDEGGALVSDGFSFCELCSFARSVVVFLVGVATAISVGFWDNFEDL
jgi:hypothetical protein